MKFRVTSRHLNPNVDTDGRLWSDEMDNDLVFDDRADAVKAAEFIETNSNKAFIREEP